jgi:uncharacterized repeat protein (TIGR01451 family)
MTSSVFGRGKRAFKTARHGGEKTMKKRRTLTQRLLSILVVLTTLMPTTLSVAPMPVVQAADTDWQSPSDNTPGAGDGFEQNPTYAYVRDGSYAENQNGPDDSHLYFGFDLVIPADAVIAGIEVRLDGGADSTDNDPQYEVDLSWGGGATDTWSSARSTNLSGTLVPTHYVLGGQSDLWGAHAWSVGDFSNTNFRVRITSRATGTGSENRDFYLDWVAVRVHYIEPAIQISKTPDDQVIASGSTASFTIVVTNTGDVVLTGVTVSDTQAPLCDRSLGILPVGGHTSYGCTLANVTDGFINSAVATGTPPVGLDVTDTDAAKVRLDNTLTCPADMIAYWNLDELSGPDYDDFYDGHDGECAGNCPTAGIGHVNGGQIFNRSDTGIDVPVVSGDDSFDWGVNDSFSIEFWMTRSGTPTHNEVIVGRNDSVTGLHWWAGTGQWAGNVAAFCLYDTGGIGTCVTGGTVITDGNWHHVVATRDADAGAIRIHVDGTEQGSASVSYTSGFDSSTAALNVGWLNLSHGYHFDGTLDEVALYNQALSPDEIQQHHNEGVAGRWYCETGTYAPLIVSDPVTDANVGRPYMYDVEATGNPAPTYTLVVSPTGMTIDPDTGLISWMPTMAQEGSHDVQVQASNSEGTDTQNFTVAVHEGTLCPADMIAYWKLNETSGTSYYDFYDGHDGECAGDCPAPATGHIGGAQEFSSTTGIDVPADAAFDWGVNDSFSIEFWMRRPGTPTGNEVIMGRDDSATGLHWWAGIGQWAGNVAAFCLYDTGGIGTCVTGGTVITDANWHHVVATRDAGAGAIRIHVDGAEEGSAPVSYTSGFDSSTAALNVGWLNLSHGYHFDGTLDEMALYDRALLTSEIQQHYNDGEPGPGYCINPDIAVNKVANPLVIYPSDTVIYTYTVTNPGDDPLSNVSWSDDKCTPMTIVGGDEDHDNELDPVESWVYTCEMTSTADIINIASVTGTYSLGGIVTATDTASVDVISPAIAIEKTAAPTIIYPDETVIYTYTVTNLGDDPLDVDLSDDQCSPLDSLGGDDNINGELDPGEIWTYRCTAIVSADITNTATVTGTDSAGGTVNATDTAFVDVINPAIEIAKTPISQTIRYGSMATFTINITNTGDALLTNVTVSDALASDCDRNDLPDLAPTENTSYACTQDNVMADFTNTAIVTGTPPVGPDVSNTDTAFVDLIGPGIVISKSPDTQMLRSGSTATFTITITNTGDAMLTNVIVSDALAPDCDRDSLPDLAPTGSTSYTCTQDNVTSDFTNIATVTGTPPVGPVVSHSDIAIVYVEWTYRIYLPLVLRE